MIAIKNTPNLTGVTISGDFNDLYNLVESLHDITLADDAAGAYHQYIGISTRVLGVCYDIRHAYQGDREIELIDNNMTDEKMKWHSIIAPKNNIYYSCNILYPEMFFVMLALDTLIKPRIKDLVKAKLTFERAVDKRVVWDKTITTIRSFQAEFAACVRSTFTKATFARWMNMMRDDYIGIEDIAGQYVDLLNVKYIKMPKEKRLKSLSSIAKRIVEFRYNKDHNEIKDIVTSAAEEYKCDPREIRLKGIEYPDNVEW